MSTIANWAYTNPLTFWRGSFDQYGQPTLERVYELPGAYQLVSTLASDGGIPTSKAAAGTDIFYFEYLGEEPPQVGWKIALGAFADDTPPASAKEIVSLTIYDVRMFGEAIPDYQVGAV